MLAKFHNNLFGSTSIRFGRFITLLILLGGLTACDVVWTKQERRAVDTVTALVENFSDAEKIARADGRIKPEKLSSVAGDIAVVNTSRYLWARKQQGLGLDYAITSSEHADKNWSIEVRVTEKGDGIVKRATPKRGLSYFFVMNYTLSSMGEWQLARITVRK